MTAAEEVGVSSHSDSTSHSAEAEVGPQVALLFLGVSLALGAACRQLLHNTRIPYTVALLLIGVGLGTLEYKESTNIGKLGQSIRMWANINPDLLLYVFLPALLFEGAYAFDIHQMKRCFLQILLLAGPGVCISTAALAVVDKYLLPYSWNWPLSLLLGGLLSSTDPVAVVSLLRELGVSKKLSSIIDGESLINDGCAIVIFQLFLRMSLGENLNAGEIITFLCRVTLGGTAIGIAFGIAGVFWLRNVFNDYVIEITITFVASYMGFFVADGVCQMSGVMAVMLLGIIFAVFARTAITGESETSMHHFWEMITYIANTLIFILSGVVIAESALRYSNYIKGSDWGYLFLLYVFVQLSRALVIILLYPFLAVCGYGMDWKEGVVCWWAGLRGAVALALALIVNHKVDGDHITSLTAARFVFHAGGVVFLTLVINGSTTQFLITFLKMNLTSDSKKRILEFTRHEMHVRAKKAFQDMEMDKELGPADWHTVRKYVHCLNKPPSDQNAHHVLDDLSLKPNGTSTAEERRLLQVQDGRLRFLNGVQAAYWTMLEEGHITQTAALLLMQAAAEAIDHAVKHHELDVWSGIKPHVKLPVYLKLLRSNAPWLPEQFFSWLTVDRLELSASMAAAFLRAQRHARQQMKGFMGDAEIADFVIKESKEEDVEAEKFLEDVRLSFPEVLRVIKTKQVTFAILVQLNQYVDSLSHAGLLDTRESTHLHDAVQKDIKSLLRRPPIVDMPTPAQILESQPLIKSLPADVSRFLAAGGKQHTKLTGSTLYKEGYYAHGVWLVVTGIVHWSSRQLDDAECDPSEKGGRQHTLAVHGATLGLYEVLAGLPYTCTVTADSVINCFYIERSRVISAYRSGGYDVADCMWQESALFMSKVLLPDILSGMTLSDMRHLFSEDSQLVGCHRGSGFDLAKSEAAVLLEGSVLLEGAGQSLRSPKGLLYDADSAFVPKDPPPHGSASAASSSHYTCNAASRVLVFPLAKTKQRMREQQEEEEAAHGHSLARQNSLARHGSHDHDGLLRWQVGVDEEDEEEEEQSSAQAPNRILSRSGPLAADGGPPLKHHVDVDVDVAVLRHPFIVIDKTGEHPPSLHSISLLGQILGGEHYSSNDELVSSSESQEVDIHLPRLLGNESPVDAELQFGEEIHSASSAESLGREVSEASKQR